MRACTSGPVALCLVRGIGAAGTHQMMSVDNVLGCFLRDCRIAKSRIAITAWCSGSKYVWA